MPTIAAWLVLISFSIRPSPIIGQHRSSCTETMSNLRASMNLTLYLQALVINLFLVVGVYKLFEKDMLFGKLGDWMYSILRNWFGEKGGEFYSKPLFTCPPCMGSVHGTLFFFGASLYTVVPWWTWPLHCLALCGLATLAMMIDGTN